MLAERETYESDEEVESSTTKEEISIGKININYEAIIANKTAQEKESLSSGMKVNFKTELNSDFLSTFDQRTIRLQEFKIFGSYPDIDK